MGHAYTCSVIVDDLLFLKKIQESKWKRNLCCQIILMLIRYFYNEEFFIEVVGISNMIVARMNIVCMLVPLFLL